MSEAIVIMRIAGERFALPVSRIQSVIDIGQIVPVPGAPAFVTGMTTLRSKSLTVIDTARSLGLEQGESSPARAAVVERKGCGYALTIDEVETVLTPNGPLAELNARLAKGWMRTALGQVETDSGAVLLLDVDKLISGPPQDLAA